MLLVGKHWRFLFLVEFKARFANKVSIVVPLVIPCTLSHFKIHLQMSSPHQIQAIIQRWRFALLAL